MWERQKGKCSFCGKRLNPSSTHYDHIKQSAHGGKSTTKNLRAVCANCHAERHNKDRAKKADSKRLLKKISDPLNLTPKIPKIKIPKIDFRI